MADVSQSTQSTETTQNVTEPPKISETQTVSEAENVQQTQDSQSSIKRSLSESGSSFLSTLKKIFFSKYT